jgi:hypothetical protein
MEKSSKSLMDTNNPVNKSDVEICRIFNRVDIRFYPINDMITKSILIQNY